jgi:hypothetical protein
MDTYVFKDFDSIIFKHITAGNNLKPFRVHTVYVNANVGVSIGVGG